MKIYRRLLTIAFVMACGQAFSQPARHDQNVNIKVPTEWIDKLRSYDYKQNNFSLLKQFESFITPDSLAGSKAYNHEEGGLLNPMFVDLDNDQNDEIIGLFGWGGEEPTLAVFKMTGRDWYLLYIQSFYMFYNPPELQVINNFSANKTFYIRWLYERGTGVYCDAYHFYKLINNKVYPCLVLVNKAHILGWGLYLNQIIDMSFKVNSANNDEILVTYDYNFFPAEGHEYDVAGGNEEEISFAKAVDQLRYGWDDSTFTYKPEKYNDPADLSAAKISCFGTFGNDSLFIKAFDYEIKQVLKKGSAREKKTLKKYLDNVEAEKNRLSPKAVIENKSKKIGNLQFYETRKEK